MKNGIPSQWLENVVNQYLKLDPEALKNLAAHKGKVLCVDALGLNQQYYIFPEEDGVEIKTDCDITPDTTIRGMPSALIKLGLQSDTAPLMLSGDIEIIGDLRLGEEFKKCLSNIEIDWEEHLSDAVGDVPANLAFNAVSRISSWAKKTVFSLQENIGEYLQEESRDVVSGAELNDFNTRVDQLRDDVARLAAALKNKTN